MEVVPAIMPDKFKDIEAYTGRVLNERVSTVQLDIMDGKFVHARTWPFAQGYDTERKFKDVSWHDVQSGFSGLPHWDLIDYELDLMTADPESMLDEWIMLGPARIILHLESLKDPYTVLQKLQGLRDTVEFGLAINNDTPTDLLYPHLEVIDCVQLMGITEIGLQGQDFDERVLEKIAEIKQRAPHMLIQVDGAVNNSTIELLEEHGVERVVVGSAFFG